MGECPWASARVWAKENGNGALERRWPLKISRDLRWVFKPKKEWCNAGYGVRQMRY